MTKIVILMFLKAIVCTKYGFSNVIQLKEIEKPTPKDNEVIIKIYVEEVTAGDGEIRNAYLVMAPGSDRIWSLRTK